VTGEKLAELMTNPEMRRMVAKAARRYTKCIEDQEEYIDDAWVIATGWGDAADIAHKKATGWCIWPCMVEWEETQ